MTERETTRVRGRFPALRPGRPAADTVALPARVTAANDTPRPEPSDTCDPTTTGDHARSARDGRRLPPPAPPRRLAGSRAGGRPRRSARQVVTAYVALTKPRIIELLLVTTVPTMLLAEGGVPSLRLVAATLVGGALAAGSANALNCYLDRDIDQVMHRTERRPLATGAVSPREALVFGAVLGAVSVGWLLAHDRLAAPPCCALAAIAFYVVVYTMALKRRTPQNIVWGGAAGLHAGAHRLVGRHRLAGLDTCGAVRGHLLLDAAALLAAVDALPRRLRRRRGADAPGGRRQRDRRAGRSWRTPG